MLRCNACGFKHDIISFKGYIVQGTGAASISPDGLVQSCSPVSASVLLSEQSSIMDVPGVELYCEKCGKFFTPQDFTVCAVCALTGDDLIDAADLVVFTQVKVRVCRNEHERFNAIRKRTKDTLLALERAFA